MLETYTSYTNMLAVMLLTIGISNYVYKVIHIKTKCLYHLDIVIRLTSKLEELGGVRRQVSIWVNLGVIGARGTRHGTEWIKCCWSWGGGITLCVTDGVE